MVVALRLERECGRQDPPGDDNPIKIVLDNLPALLQQMTKNGKSRSLANGSWELTVVNDTINNRAVRAITASKTSPSGEILTGGIVTDPYFKTIIGVHLQIGSNHFIQSFCWPTRLHPTR